MVECVEDQNFAGTGDRDLTDESSILAGQLRDRGRSRPMTGDERQTAIDVGDEPDDEPKVTTKAPSAAKST